MTKIAIIFNLQNLTPMLQDVPILIRILALGMLASALWMAHAISRAPRVDSQANIIPKPRRAPNGISHTIPAPKSHRNFKTWVAYIRLQSRK